jgi:hypothetical protein
MSGKSLMNGSGESHCDVVPTKQPNKGDSSPAEVVEGRSQTRRTRGSLTWAGHRAGKLGRAGWSVCVKQQEGTGS